VKENLRRLDEASRRPWVLLIAGVDFPEYKRQVELAVQAGASGVLGGRGFWKEYFLKEGTTAREQFAKQESAERVRQIDEIVQRSATPWYIRYDLTMDDLRSIRAAENWHFRYGEVPSGNESSGRPAEGDVY
jgi:tagatose 1,6-diphosphate aldolase